MFAVHLMRTPRAIGVLLGGTGRTPHPNPHVAPRAALLRTPCPFSQGRGGASANGMTER